MIVLGNMMLGALAGALVALLVGLVRLRAIERAHRRKIAELDEIGELTNKAAAAKNSEAYEHYMAEAVRRMDEYSKKYP